MRIFYVLLTVFVFFVSPQAFSQNLSVLVLDSASRQPIDSVELKGVYPRNPANNFILFSNKSGQISAAVNAGGIRISVEKDGFISKSFFRFIMDGRNISDTVFLVNLAVSINRAEIRAIAPVIQKGDTTEYNASSFKVNSDATAEDLVRKMPGITMENGKIKAHGEEVKKVTLDGKEFFGDDAQTALRNLPAEVVDKIQVFDRMSDQAQFTGFDDGQGVKSINIKSKTGKANGTFGKIYGGLGTDERYQSGLVYNKFKGDRRLTLLGMSNNINNQNFTSQDLLGLSTGSGDRGGGPGRGPGGYFSSPVSGNFLVDQAGGISKTHSTGINFNDKWGKKFTIGASYFFNNSVNNIEQNILRINSNNFNPENRQEFSQLTSAENAQFNHRFNLRLEYTIDSNNSLVLTPTVSLQNSKSGQTMVAKTYNPLHILNTGNTWYNASGNGVNMNNNLLYRHKFKKDGRTFTTNLQQQYNETQNESVNISTNRSYIPTDSVFIIDQKAENQTPVESYNVRFTYTEPLGKLSMLQFDYRMGTDINKTDKQTVNFNPSEYRYNLFDTALSNGFNTHYNYHQPGLMYRYRGKSSWVSAGTGFQYATLIGDQRFPVRSTVNKTFINLLPRVFMNLKFKKNNNLRLMYRSSTRVPSVAQFQEVVNTSNPLLLTTGNPDLKQELSQNVVLRYNSSRPFRHTSFFAGLYVTQTSGAITNSTRFITKDSQISEGFTAVRGAQITNPVNLNGYWNNRLSAYYAFPVKKLKTNMNVNGTYSLNRNPGLVNGVNNMATTQNANTGIAASSNISEAIDFGLSYNFSYYHSVNSTQKLLNNNYINHLASAKGTFTLKKKWVFGTEVIYNKFSGLSSSFNQDFALWNAAIAYKFMKKNQSEIRISCFDILKQNRSISRNITEAYIEDNYTQVLTRYLMVTLTWNFRKFANGGSEPKPDTEHHHNPGVTPLPGGLPTGRPPLY